jgi:hypothetical protein
MRPFQKGDHVLVKGIVINNLENSLGVIFVDCKDIQERITATAAKNLILVDQPIAAIATEKGELKAPLGL